MGACVWLFIDSQTKRGENYTYTSYKSSNLKWNEKLFACAWTISRASLNRKFPKEKLSASLSYNKFSHFSKGPECVYFSLSLSLLPYSLCSLSPSSFLFSLSPLFFGACKCTCTAPKNVRWVNISTITHRPPRSFFFLLFSPLFTHSPSLDFLFSLKAYILYE